MARVLVIPDIHEPWSHPKAIPHCQKAYQLFKCDRVVQLGDEVDFASFSRFPLNPDMPGAGHELELAIEGLRKWFLAFPHVEVCESNHGMRIFRKAFASGLPKRVLRRYEEILTYPKGWHFNDKPIEIDGVTYMHGEGLSQGSWKTAHHKLKGSVVIGHLHSGAGVLYSQTKRRHFTMNTGCLIDPKADAFSYGKHLIEKPTLGCGVVIDGQSAHFIPLNE